MTEDNKKRQDLLFLILLIFFIGVVALFNYSVDPYNVTKAKIINGFNDNKIHKLTNKRSNIYADIKLNKKNKDKAFVGNCLLSETNDTPNNIAFFSIPVVKMEVFILRLLILIQYIGDFILMIFITNKIMLLEKNSHFRTKNF